MKEAVLDFARRHELPLPSWWTDASAPSSAPANLLTSEHSLPVPLAASDIPAGAGTTRKRGRKPRKLEQAKEAMWNDIQCGRRTVEDLREMGQKELAAQYGGVSRDTACRALAFVEKSILDKKRQTTISDTQNVTP